MSLFAYLLLNIICYESVKLYLGRGPLVQLFVHSRSAVSWYPIITEESGGDLTAVQTIL